MKILLLLSILLCAPAAAAQASAPATDARDPRPARMEARHPAAMLLQRQDSLGLSPEQVGRLRRIQQGFAARSQVLWAAIQAPERMEREEEQAARRASAPPPSEARREAIHRARLAAREAEMELRETARATGEEAFAVLTAEQRARLGSPASGN